MGQEQTQEQTQEQNGSRADPRAAQCQEQGPQHGPSGTRNACQEERQEYGQDSDSLDRLEETRSLLEFWFAGGRVPGHIPGPIFLDTPCLPRAGSRAQPRQEQTQEQKPGKSKVKSSKGASRIESDWPFPGGVKSKTALAADPSP